MWDWLTGKLLRILTDGQQNLEEAGAYETFEHGQGWPGTVNTPNPIYTSPTVAETFETGTLWPGT